MNATVLRRIIVFGLGGLAALGVAAQAAPYRVTHPSVTAEPQWDSAQTEALARRACGDCHSNEGNVPWYGYVAPFSWVVRRHVDQARAVFNFSEMDRGNAEAEEAGETVLEGEMPPRWYLRLHPEARLTDSERFALAAGLDATLGGEGEGGGEGAVEAGEGPEDEGDEDDVAAAVLARADGDRAGLREVGADRDDLNGRDDRDDRDDRLGVDPDERDRAREAGDREAGDREAGDREAGDREAGDREAGDRDRDDRDRAREPGDRDRDGVERKGEGEGEEDDD